jgi:hypothetical protein
MAVGYFLFLQEQIKDIIINNKEEPSSIYTLRKVRTIRGGLEGRLLLQGLLLQERIARITTLQRHYNDILPPRMKWCVCLLLQDLVLGGWTEQEARKTLPNTKLWAGGGRG